MDCHSNATTWPWYSQVAPASWLVADDVAKGRRHMNLSEWGRLSPERRLQALGGMCREVTMGEMPPSQYLLIHRGARLQPADMTAVCLVSTTPQ